MNSAMVQSQALQDDAHEAGYQWIMDHAEPGCNLVKLERDFHGIVPDLVGYDLADFALSGGYKALGEIITSQEKKS